MPGKVPTKKRKFKKVANKKNALAKKTALERQLERQCEIVDRGMTMIADVAQALLSIRDNVLYRKTILPGEKTPCESFDKFCQYRFGFGERQAYKYLKAAPIHAALPAPPRSIRASIELAAVPESDREEVCERAGGRDATTASVREVAKVVAESAAPALPPAIDETPTDATGKVIVAVHVKKAFEIGDRQLLDMIHVVHALAMKLQELSAHSDFGNHLNKQALQVDLAAVAATIRFARPHAVCPYCKGNRCEHCRSAGWMPKQVFDRVPEAVKR